MAQATSEWSTPLMRPDSEENQHFESEFLTKRVRIIKFLRHARKQKEIDRSGYNLLVQHVSELLKSGFRAFRGAALLPDTMDQVREEIRQAISEEDTEEQCQRRADAVLVGDMLQRMHTSDPDPEGYLNAVLDVMDTLGTVAASLFDRLVELKHDPGRVHNLVKLAIVIMNLQVSRVALRLAYRVPDDFPLEATAAQEKRKLQVAELLDQRLPGWAALLWDVVPLTSDLPLS